MPGFDAVQLAEQWKRRVTREEKHIAKESDHSSRSSPSEHAMIDGFSDSDSINGKRIALLRETLVSAGGSSAASHRSSALMRGAARETLKSADRESVCTASTVCCTPSPFLSRPQTGLHSESDGVPLVYGGSSSMGGLSSRSFSRPISIAGSPLRPESSRSSMPRTPRSCRSGGSSAASSAILELSKDLATERKKRAEVEAELAKLKSTLVEKSGSRNDKE